MNGTEPRLYDLNISENYVPKWGAWEVGREVVSNAIDADRAGYKTEILSQDHIRVTTRTAPTLAQIKFIGGGTKQADGQTIGCFGEGIKLAAMVAKRMGGHLKARFGKYAVSYELTYHEDLGQRCAIMSVTDQDDDVKGLVIDVEVEGIASAVAGKFLDKPNPGFVEKRDPEKLVLYNKGVFVAEKPQKSLFDWNLAASINRDRDIIDSWEVGYHVTSLLTNSITKDIAMKIIEDREVFEMECIRKHPTVRGARMGRAFCDALKERYGADCIMASNDRHANAIATRLGKKVIIVDETIREVVMIVEPGERIQSAEEIVTMSDRYEPIDRAQFDLKDLERLADILDQPCEIFIFNGAGFAELGRAEFKDGMRRVFLSSRLFEPGARASRFATFVHELAHIESMSGDGELKFQDELTRLSGVLAKRVIDNGR